jgi:hypothetical protein
VDERSLSDKARGHYNAAVHSKPRGDGKIPNVIRAYYAAYAPNPSFRPPKKTTPVPVSVPTPISVFSSGFSDRSGDMKDSQTGQSNSKRSYSEANNHNNNNNHSNSVDLNNNNNNRNNEFNSKVEIYESKKYVGKYYITDPKTNAAVWIEIISKFENNNNTNNNNDSINKVFNRNSDIDNFYFIDPKNSLKIGISKAHFIPK